MSVSTLIPAMRDALGDDNDTLLLAAGGITDGRGLASALCLGADGALVGTGYLASHECMYPDEAKGIYVTAKGEHTGRNRVFDIWLDEMLNTLKFTDGGWDVRMVRNEQFIEKWIGKEDELKSRFDELKADFYENEGPNQFILSGEGVDRVRAIASAKTITERMAEEAAQQIQNVAGVCFEEYEKLN